MVRNHLSYVDRGKTIRQLIKELETFEDQDLEVMISIDDGERRAPISLVGKDEGVCLLVHRGNCLKGN